MTLIDLLGDGFEQSDRLSRKEIQLALKHVTGLVGEQRLRWERELGVTVPLTLTEQHGNQIGKALQNWLVDHIETELGPPIVVTSPEAWPDDVRRAAERVERESNQTQFTAVFDRTCREAGVFVGELIRLRDPTRYWTIAPDGHADGPNNLLSLCSTINGRTIYLPTRMIAGTMYRNHVWCDTVDPYKSGIAQLIRAHVAS